MADEHQLQVLNRPDYGFGIYCRESRISIYAYI